ncbi:uncharacterized protein C8R40DRAFT_1240395 [Lentinula edodes]|uniref:uncharacterized protein n=1 Tax=Lentinula edodes TaxID=5353 RepID=UPI001E8D6E90|nr:uncharacterized protein C8R40DRAFT_1240395 [Lentinula edodes]KAH7870494.1 hypothetical protein C8R40DRAFT_1240395 [Lentinula edodes]
MPPSRLSTVFDLSSLRLHTDGSLVQQTTKNNNLRSSKRTVRDTHGNWMAKDAGGLTFVPKYRKVLPMQREDEGKGSITEDYLDNAAPRVDFFAQQPTLKTSRARKRRKFATDEEYLAPMLPLRGSSALKNDSESILQPQLAHPSSDLLKCIHYYASMYYDERGLLLNVSRQYRKERKARRLAKLAQDGRTARTKTRSSSDTGKFSGLEEDAIIDDEDGDEESERDHQEEPTKAPVRRKDHDIADMYKTMDGSALIAIGMLLQEHINELLHPQTVSSAEL